MVSARKDKKPEIKFSQVIKALTDPENVFPPGFTHQLSSLNASQLQTVRKIWGSIPLERRRALLEDMEDFSDADFLLDFSPIASLALEDGDGIVRAFAVRILRSDEEPENIPLFLNLMNNDPEAVVRAAAASAFAPLVYAGELEELPAGLLKEVEEALLEKYRSSDSEEVRRRALESLGFSSRPEVTGLIREAYQNGAQHWQVSALFAMGRTANEEWAPQVLASLKDQRPLVRAEAAAAAGELELADAAPLLLDLLDDASNDVRSACIWSLSQIGGEGVRERLEQMVDENEDDEILDILEEALENLNFNEEFLPVTLDFDGWEDDENEDEDDPPAPPAPGSSKRTH